MDIDTLINTANDIGDSPDMFHPDYGWIRKDGKTTEAGLDYFKDQLDKLNPHLKVGHA